MFFLPVGLIQALMSPVSGFLSDKINPKIPGFLGMSLLGLGLYMQSYLSLYSNTSQITIPLIIRGFGMGMIMAPLGSLALSKLPREKLAQASGLFNVIRQLGGSFGVAVMGTLLSRQVIIHTANYGQSVDRYSPVFQQAVQGFKFMIQQSLGKNAMEALSISQTTVIQNIAGQAFVQAICDDFLLAGLATFACVIPLLILKNPKHREVKVSNVNME